MIRKITTVGLAVALCAGLAAPVSATGYASGPWYYTPRTPSRSSSSGGGSSNRDSDRNLFYPSGSTSGGGTTTIADNQTPLTSGATTPASETLKNNNGAAPVTAAQVKKNANGVIALVNASKISPALFAGITGVVHNDVKVGNAIVARFYLDAQQIASASKEIDLSLSTDPADTGVAKARFEKHFKGNFAVVSLAQKSSFGMNVRVAINTAVLKGVDLTKLNVLIYNKYTNTYAKVAPENVQVQGNYVYVTIPKGGELIFTDSTQF